MMPEGEEPGITLTDDRFLGGRLAILQPATDYRAGLDAVLLAAAAPLQTGRQAHVLDAGSGVGVVGLAVAARVAEVRSTLVEIDPVLAGIARRNANRNGLANRVTVVEADILAGGAILHATSRPGGLAPAMFDHVVTNPPYFVTGAGTPSSRPRKAVAHAMPADGLHRWVAFLATAARADATLTLIHRADALATILAALEGRFGRIRVLPIHPRSGAPAGLVLISARKGSRAPLEIQSGLALQGADGRYRTEVEAILREGAALDMTGSRYVIA